MDNTIKINYREADKLTFTEWEAIHKEIRREEKAEKSYYIKQKLLGLAAVCVAIACPLLLDGDATASLIMLPLGLYALFTKEKIFTFN